MQYARYFCGEHDGTVISEEEYRFLEATDQLTSDAVSYEPIFDGTIYPTLAESSAAQIAAYGYHYDDDRRRKYDELTPYRVTISEVFTRGVVIYAEDKYEAEEIAENLCNNGVINLDAEDFGSRNTDCHGPAAPNEMILYQNYTREGVIPPAPRQALSEARPGDMLVFMINTYIDAVYGTTGDYDRIKADIMTATGMDEQFFDLIKDELELPEAPAVKPSLTDQIRSAESRSTDSHATKNPSRDLDLSI